MRIPIEITGPKKPIVLFVTPSHDGKLNCCHAVSVANCMGKRLFAMQQYIPNKSGISKARNFGIYHALKEYPECTHVMSVDSDIEFQPEMIVELIKRDVPIVGALYAHKSEELRWCLNLVKPEGAKDGDEVKPITEGPLAGLLPVRTLGTGFKLIKKEVIHTIIEKFGPELAYIEDQEGDGITPKGEVAYGFYQEHIESENGPRQKLERIRSALANPAALSEITAILDEPQKPGRWLTEDWFFCHLAERAGIPMYVDVRFNVRHEGSIFYPLAKHEVNT